MMKRKRKTETKNTLFLKLPYSVKKRTFLKFIKSFVAYFFMLKLVFPGIFRKLANISCSMYST